MNVKIHRTIPFFIPHQGCPFGCVFCSQKKISGRAGGAALTGIAGTIRRYIRTMPGAGARIEVGFFGGSFTGLPAERQEAYLRRVQPFIENGAVSGIRLSTRPDYISQDILDMLKRYHVSAIELGVQSLSDDVLRAAGRGHTALDVKNASRLILENGFTLGHQIMVGLPLSTPAIELKTARASIGMGAAQARIYPVVVIKSTALAAMWRKGAYKPLTEKEAVRRCARLAGEFGHAGVRVLRCGLHPSPGLLSGRDILAGPFHPAFGQKVQTYRCGIILNDWLKKEKRAPAVKHILFSPRDAGCVIGYGRENAARVEKAIGRRKAFKSSEDIPPGAIAVECSGGRNKIIGRFY